MVLSAGREGFRAQESPLGEGVGGGGFKLMYRVGPARPAERMRDRWRWEPCKLVRWAPEGKCRDLGTPGGSVPGLDSEMTVLQTGQDCASQNQISEQMSCS